MKKILTLMSIGILILLFNGIATAADYTYYTYGLQYMSHDSAYSWQINTSAIDFENESIESASLYFYDLGNDYYPDALFVSLLDNPSSGIKYFYDNVSGIDNYFDGPTDTELLSLSSVNSTSRDVFIDITDVAYSGPLEEDDLDWLTESPDLNGEADISLPGGGLTHLAQYAQDGIFGLGFDADCHYWDSKIKLVIRTSDNPSPPNNPVPEPQTLLLFGLGLIGISAFGRKRMNVGDEIS